MKCIEYEEHNSKSAVQTCLLTTMLHFQCYLEKLFFLRRFNSILKTEMRSTYNQDWLILVKKILFLATGPWIIVKTSKRTSLKFLYLRIVTHSSIKNNHELPNCLSCANILKHTQKGQLNKNASRYIITIYIETASKPLSKVSTLLEKANVWLSIHKESLSATTRSYVKWGQFMKHVSYTYNSM